MTNIRPHRAAAWFVSAVFACAALTSCTKPKVPDQDVPPDPQAATSAVPANPTSLNDAIHQPIDEAKAVREATEEDAKKQREKIDAATGG